MNLPRYNNFRVDLPPQLLPKWLIDLYTEILTDAGMIGLYAGNPIQCIMESLVGIDLPGLHLVLVEQQTKDVQKTGSITRFWPKGTNSMKVLDDNEMALTFRHIDGFHNYYMLREAINYMADDNAQSILDEVYKSIGNLTVTTQLSKNYQLVNIYQDMVYSNIDGNNFAYAKMASENTFTIRCKYIYYYSEYYYKGKCISKTLHTTQPASK
jgi:hypothetical protein